MICLSCSNLLSEQTWIDIHVNKYTRACKIMTIYPIINSVVFWTCVGVGHLTPFLALTPQHLTNVFLPTSYNLQLFFNANAQGLAQELGVNKC